MRLTKFQKGLINTFAELDTEEMNEIFNHKTNQIESLYSPVAEEPDYEWAERFLIDTRTEQVLIAYDTHS